MGGRSRTKLKGKKRLISVKTHLRTARQHIRGHKKGNEAHHRPHEMNKPPGNQRLADSSLQPLFEKILGLDTHRAKPQTALDDSRRLCFFSSRKMDLRLGKTGTLTKKREKEAKKGRILSGVYSTTSLEFALQMDSIPKNTGKGGKTF